MSNMTIILPHKVKFVFEESQVMNNNKMRVQFFFFKFVGLLIRKGASALSPKSFSVTRKRCKKNVAARLKF